MKTLTNFRKRYPYILSLGIIILISGIIVFFLLQVKDEKANDNFLSKKIENFKDKLGENRAKVETRKQGDFSEFRKSEIDSLRKALDLERADKINAITEMRGVLRDSLKMYAVKLDAEKHKVWEWEKKYKSGSVFRATMNEKDSVLIAEADSKVQTADIEEGRGKKKKFFTEFYTPDQNIKFNGAKTYRVEQKEIKDILQVDLKTGFRKGFLVSDYDQLESTLQVLVLPDGEFSIGFGAGGIYIVKDGRIFPYGEIFLRKNLFRIRGR